MLHHQKNKISSDTIQAQKSGGRSTFLKDNRASPQYGESNVGLARFGGGSKPNSAVVQRVIKLAQVSSEYPKTDFTVMEMFENIKGTREARRYIDAYGGEDALIDFLRAFDGRTVESRSSLVNQIGRAAKKDPEVEGKRSEWYEREAGRYNIRALGVLQLGKRRMDEMFYKLSLIRNVAGDGASVNRFMSFLLEVCVEVHAGKIEQEGVVKTISTLTTSWSETPSNYAEDYAQHGGESSLAGIEITIMGLIGELSALFHAAQKRLDHGEVVHSASVYQDEAAGVEEDVDVSYIDSHQVLHLVEVAGNLNVLFNKATGSDLKAHAGADGQKQRYQHLATRSKALRHTPVGSLRGLQARDRAVSHVQFSYSVPEHGFFPAVFSRKGITVLNALVRAGATLQVGRHDFSISDLSQMVQRISRALGLARRLEVLAPDLMHALWNTLGKAQRSDIRAIVFNEMGLFANIFHHIFHRQRKGVGTGLAGYMMK